MSFLKSKEVELLHLTNGIKILANRLKDGNVYGEDGVNIYRLDNGVWNQITNLEKVKLLVPTGTNEVLAVCGSLGLFKSVGWGTGSVTWIRKLYEEGSDFLSWGLDSVGGLAIATHYRATDYTKSRYTWLSTDNGDTWTVVHDLGVNSDVHMHLAHIDQYNNNRLWISYHQVEVANKIKAIKYSDDLGATWNLLTDEWQPTTAVATPNGMVFGTDDGPGGILHVPNKTNAEDLSIHLACPFPVERSPYAWVFAIYAEYNEQIGAAVTTFISQVDGTPAGVFVSDGITGRELLRSTPQLNTYGFREFCFHDGHVLINASLDGIDYIMSIEEPVRGEDPIGIHDTGRILGGRLQDQDNFTSIAVGLDSLAGPSKDCISVGVGSRAGTTNNSGPGCVALGSKAVAEKMGAVAIGLEAEAHFGSVCIGHTSKSSTVDISIGRNATCNGHSLSVGHDSQAATSSVALGRLAKSTGYRSVALGRDAVCTHTNSVSIGYATTSEYINTVSVGDRDILLGKRLIMTTDDDRHVALRIDSSNNIYIENL